MAYSKDLRIKAVTYFLTNGLPYRETASIFNIGVGTLHAWVKRFRVTCNVEAKKPKGRERLLSVDKHEAFKDLISKNSDNTLSQLSDKWYEKEGQRLSIFSVSRSIRRLGFTLKKNQRCFRA